jgi:membrane protein required for colicin V production
MSLFDWSLIAVLAYSTILAFLRGIILELFSLGGLIVGILLACWNYNQVAHLLSPIIRTPSIAQIVAFLLIICVVTILCTVLGKALNRTAHAIGLGIFDRLLGAVFGFGRGCLIGIVILMVVAAFWPNSTWTKNSQLTPYFLEGVHAVSFVVPHDFQQLIWNGAEQLKHDAPDWIKPLR